MIFCGYRVAWQGPLDLQDQSPTARIRWLRIAVPVSDHLPPLRFQPWNRIVSPTPISEDAVLSFSMEDAQQLALPPETADLAANLKYHKAFRNRAAITPNEVMKNRVNDGHSRTPTVMAMYGSQHELDTSFLEKHGYFGHFNVGTGTSLAWSFWWCLLGWVVFPELPASRWHDYQSACNLCVAACLKYCWHCIAYSIWAFSRFQRLKMRASTLCVNPTRFGSFVTHQHWPCSTTRIACIEQLFEAFKTEPSTIRCWSCALGLNFTWQIGTISDFVSDVSQPSQLTPTCHFILVVCGLIKSEEVEIRFGFTANLPLEAISEQWMGLFGFNQIPIRFGLSLATLSLLKKFPNHLPYRWFWGRIWHFFCLRITKPYSTTRLLKDLSLHSLISLRLFSASVDFPIQAGLLLRDLPFVFAAARQVDIEREYIPSRDQYVLRFRGMDQPVQVLSTLYQNAISSSTLDKLGRPVTVFTQPGFVDLIFGNVQPVATCSPKAFGKAVAIAAVRLLLNTLV